MTKEPPEDFSKLPPSVSVDETIAYQLEKEEIPFGPEGGGGAIGVDGDGD